MNKKILLASAILASIYSTTASSTTNYNNTVSTPVTEESSTIKNIVPDTAITASIKTKYAADEQINAFKIHVETINGRVILTGKVPSLVAKEKAINIAKETEGTKEVVANLEISHN